MKQILLRFCLVCACVASGTFGVTFAQYVAVQSIDASAFPKIKATVLVGDKNGNPVRDADLQSVLRVSEDGKPMTYSISCPPTREAEPISVLLVNDKSLSMETAPSDDPMTGIELLRRGNIELLNTIAFIPPTSVAISAFDVRSFLISDWTDSRSTLIGAVSSINGNDGVGTNYQAAFLDDLTGAITLLKQRPTSMKRVIVYLTDGMPTEPFDVNAVVNECKKEQIIVFAITLRMPMNADLSRIARETGGLDFPNVRNATQIAAVYKLIAKRLQGVDPCEITWTAPYGCSEASRIRDVNFNLPALGVQTSSQYIAPSTSISRLDYSKTLLSMGSPLVGITTSQTITITAINSSFSVTNPRLVPANPRFVIKSWGGSAPPFTLAAGESRQVTFEYTAINDRSFHIATLLLDGSPCPPQELTLYGGDPPLDASPIQIISPKGGEVLSACDSVVVVWGGVPDYRPIILEFSIDGGQNWRTIDTNLRGLTFTWRPPIPNVNYLLRAIAPGGSADWVWARQATSTALNFANDIASDKVGNVFVVGQIGGATSLNGKNVSGTSFVAKYDQNGNIQWVSSATVFGRAANLKIAVSGGTGEIYGMGTNVVVRFNGTIGSPTQIATTPFLNVGNYGGKQELIDIETDNSGNLFVGGYALDATRGYTFFLRKYNRAGTQVWEKLIRGIKPYALAIGITGNIFLTGDLDPNGSVTPQIVDFGGGITFGTNQAGKFLAEFRAGDGSTVWAKRTFAEVNTVTEIAVNKDEEIFQVGSNSTGRDFGSKILDNFGRADGFLAKFTPQATDVAWVINIGSDNDDAGIDVACDLSGDCYVLTNYTGASGIQYGKNGKKLQGNNNDLGMNAAVAKIAGATGNVIYIGTTLGARDEEGKALALDPINKPFVAGRFNATAKFTLETLKSNQPVSPTNGDMFIGRLSALVQGADTLDKPFKVESPALSLKAGFVDLGAMSVFKSTNATIPGFICNNGTVPIFVKETFFQGGPSVDFKVTSRLDSIIIRPGECVTFEVNFTPQTVGNRTARFVIHTTCDLETTIDLRGIGTEQCQYETTNLVYSGVITVGKDTTVTSVGAFKNLSQFTTLELQNIRIEGPGKQYFTIVSATTASIPPGGTYDVQVRFAPLDSGRVPDAVINYGVISECGIATTLLQGNGFKVIPPATISTAIGAFASTLCDGDSSQAYVYIYNNGGQSLIVDGAQFTVNNEGFRLVNPPTTTKPLIIASKSRDSVLVKFIPTGSAGLKNATVSFSSNVTTATGEISFSARREGYAVSSVLPQTTFAAALPSEFPFVQDVEFVNNSTLPLQILGASVRGGASSDFEVISVDPSVNVGGKFVVKIRLNKPQNAGITTEVLDVTTFPQCSGVSTALSGEMRIASAAITAPIIELDPTQKNVRIPISSKVLAYPTLTGNKPFSLRIEFASSVFLPLSFEGANVLTNVNSNGKRTIELSGKFPINSTLNQDFELVTMVGDALLGDIVETPLTVSVISQSNNDILFSTTSGKLTTKICTAGGNRLITPVDPSFEIIRITPNPVVDEISVKIGAIEVGMHIVEICDVQGNIVHRTEWTESLESVPAERTLNFAAHDLPAGMYVLRFKTPARVFSGHVGVVR